MEAASPAEPEKSVSSNVQMDRAYRLMLKRRLVLESVKASADDARRTQMNLTSITRMSKEGVLMFICFFYVGGVLIMLCSIFYVKHSTATGRNDPWLK